MRAPSHKDLRLPSGRHWRAAPCALFILCLCGVSQATVIKLDALPAPGFPDTEVSTNICINAARDWHNLWRLRIDVAAASGCNVEAVFGVDSNTNGVLDIEEGELAIGLDCSEWFVRDRRAGTLLRSEIRGSRNLDWRMRMDENLVPARLSGFPFSDDAPPATYFNRRWNIVRVMAGGAEPPTASINGYVSSDGLRIKIR